MKLWSLLTIFLLLGLAAAAPSSKESSESSESKEDNEITITKEFFPESFVVYKSKYDIVNILVPINNLNFDDDSDDENEDSKITLFFVEANVDSNGNKEYKGLYVLIGEEATKILDNGRDAAAAGDESKEVFFGAQDGIYTYNDKEKTAEKYGSVTESIIGIAKENGSDVIYILTEDHDVYKVTGNGEKKEKLDDIVDAEEIVLDYSNNLYFYGADKRPYVVNADGVTRITGLPKNPKSVKLLKAPFIIEDGVPFISDNTAYIIFANGTSVASGFDFAPKAKPTAYGMEGALIQYFAYDKKIYEYNILLLVLSELLDDLKKFLENKVGTIQSMASRSRPQIRVRTNN